MDHPIFSEPLTNEESIHEEKSRGPLGPSNAPQITGLEVIKRDPLHTLGNHIFIIQMDTLFMCYLIPYPGRNHA